MEFEACPVAFVAAPIDVVWSFLTDPARYGDFYDLRVTSVAPPGRAHVGQTLVGDSGPRALHLGVRMTYLRVDDGPADKRELHIDVQLPLGVRVREEMEVAALGPDRTRVNYHCKFGFPRGVRGALVRRLLGDALVRGPQDSIDRLQRAAESVARERAPAEGGDVSVSGGAR